MRTKIHTTLLRLLPVLCLALVANIALAQQHAESSAPRNVITGDGQAPTSIASKSAPAQEATPNVTFEDGSVANFEGELLSTYDAKPKISSEAAKSIHPDPQMMEAWVLNFVEWRANNPQTFAMVLSPLERTIVFGSGDLRQLYAQLLQNAYLQNQRDNVRLNNGQ